jgi:hypothetical protein
MNTRCVAADFAMCLMLMQCAQLCARMEGPPTYACILSLYKEHRALYRSFNTMGNGEWGHQLLVLVLVAGREQEPGVLWPTKLPH